MHRTGRQYVIKHASDVHTRGSLFTKVRGCRSVVNEDLPAYYVDQMFAVGTTRKEAARILWEVRHSDGRLVITNILRNDYESTPEGMPFHIKYCKNP